MLETKRVLWLLVAIAVCGCMVCQPTPTPPTPDPFWDPVGAAKWPTDAFSLTPGRTLERGFAGQGSDVRHVELGFEVARPQVMEGAVTARLLWRVTRENGTVVAKGSEVRFIDPQSLAPGDGGQADLVLMRICPPQNPGAVVDTPLQLEVWLAEDASHQLLQSGTRALSVSCASADCPCQ